MMKTGQFPFKITESRYTLIYLLVKLLAFVYQKKIYLTEIFKFLETLFHKFIKNIGSNKSTLEGS